VSTTTGYSKVYSAEILHIVESIVSRLQIEFRRLRISTDTYIYTHITNASQEVPAVH